MLAADAQLDVGASRPAPLRSEFELDSLDFLGFAETLASRTGVPIAEADYPRLATMATCVEFLTGARDGT